MTTVPLFRKKRQSQAERLASWRSGAVSKGAADGVGPLLEELGVSAQEESRGWVADVGGGNLFLATAGDGTVLSAWAGVEDTHDPGELRTLLRRNLDPTLTWVALGEGDAMGVRCAVPLDGFDRAAALLALESAAGALGDEGLAARARESRAPARGEQAEQAAEERGRAALEGAAAALDLELATERPGVWRIALDRGRVEAVLRDTGESLMLLHELEYTGGDADVDVLRWLLQASDWHGARLGLADLPGGPGLFAACAVPAHALEPQGLAWGLVEVLSLCDDYDRLAQ